jgi:multidrug resistance efflux pump
MHAVFDRPLTLDETKQLRLPVIGGLLAGMNHNHPFTSDARIYFYTTPISPTV